MKLKKELRRRKRISAIILYSLAFLWMIPLVWSVATSLKTDSEITNNVLGLIPRDITFHRYEKLLIENSSEYPLHTWFLNSLFVAAIYTFLYLFIASLAAYAFSILKFKGRDKIFWFILATTMIPGVINLVPMITMMVDFGWMGSFLALIIPGLGGVFGLFIIRQFFLQIPNELIESAQLDGLNHFGIYLKIVLPLSTSAFMVSGLFVFLGNWNDYLWPLLVMSGSGTSKFTLPVGLSVLQGSYNYDYGLTMAAAIISIVPVIIVYIFTQEKIIEGIARTGIK